MERSYLVRFGLMGHVGRFEADVDAVFERGQGVVVRSHRGTELGEVLIESPRRVAPEVLTPSKARVLRAPDAEDVRLARRGEAEREQRFRTCGAVFQDGRWPLELIDVEPLLDDRRTVLYILGPYQQEVAEIISRLRGVCDLDVIFHPAGRDVIEDGVGGAGPVVEADQGCGRCGPGGGGCGSSAGGCSSCGVKKLLTARG